MVIQVNVAEAKTQLSRLLDAAVAGNDIVIARAGRPMVRLVPIEAPAARRLGFLDIEVPDDTFAPLDDAELGHWE